MISLQAFRRVFLPMCVLSFLVTWPGEGAQPDKGEAASFPMDLLALPHEAHRSWEVRNASTMEHGLMRCYIHLSKEKKQEDWLLMLRFGERVGDVGGFPESRLFSSTGREFWFEKDPFQMQCRLVGPLLPTVTKVSQKEATITVNRQNLSLGFHQLVDFFDAGAAIRARFPESPSMRYQGKTEPFDPDPMLSDLELLEEVGLTADVERAFLGTVPALLEFFGIIYETPGLKGLLQEMIPARRVLGLLNPFSGRSVGFSYGSPVPYSIDVHARALGMDTLTVVPVELQLNNRPVMNLSLFATEPEGGWELSAGIVFLLVEAVPPGKGRLIIRFAPEDSASVESPPAS